MGQNTRYDPEYRRKEEERERQERADSILREQLRDMLLTALRSGPDAIYLMQRAVGHDLVRLRLLDPAVRFVSSTGEPADRIVEVPVEVPSTEPFDPHELESAQLLQLVRTRLWEDTRISQAERVHLIALCSAIMQRLGSVAKR